MSEQNQEGSQSGGSLGVIFLTVFIDLIGFSIIFPLFPAMLDYYLPREGDAGLLAQLVGWLRHLSPSGSFFHVTVLFGGILGGLYSLLQFVMSPIWGRLSDRYGRRRILLITTTGTFAGYLLWIFSGQFILLLASRIIGGIMAGNIAVATAAVADVTTRENRSKGMGLIGMAFGLGFIIGPAIGGLSTLWNPVWTMPGTAKYGLNPFSLPAICAAALALANVIWVYRAFSETFSSVPTDTSKPSGYRRSWFSFIGLKNPNIRKATRTYLMFIFTFSAMEFTLTFLAAERLLYNPREMIGVFLFVGFILAFTQGFFVRRYARKFGEVNLVLAGLLCVFLGLLTLGQASQPFLFYSGLGFLGIGIGLSSPSLTALVSLYAPSEKQGAEMGAFRSAGSLGRALGPLAGAVTYWSLGSYTAYNAASGLVIVAFLLAIGLPQPSVSEETSA